LIDKYGNKKQKKIHWYRWKWKLFRPL
jgi:hypothetical protein